MGCSLCAMQHPGAAPAPVVAVLQVADIAGAMLALFASGSRTGHAVSAALGLSLHWGGQRVMFFVAEPAAGPNGLQMPMLWQLWRL